MSEWLRALSEPINPVPIDLSISSLGAQYFLPVAIICGLCILATALWAAAIAKYASSHGGHI